MDLLDEYRLIRDSHEAAMIRTAARVVLGPSIIRVFRRGTKEALLGLLGFMPVASIKGFTGPEEYDRWFRIQLRAVARTVRALNPKNSRILPGYKWGHAAKVLNVFLRDTVLHTRYFDDSTVRRVSPWLHAPVDSIVLDKLRKLGHKFPFQKIKEIDSASKFYQIQSLLQGAASDIGVPRVWFDDNWGNRS